MVEILGGRVIEVRPTQPENAKGPIDNKLFPKCTDIKLVHPSKAP